MKLKDVVVVSKCTQRKYGQFRKVKLPKYTFLFLYTKCKLLKKKNLGYTVRVQIDTFKNVSHVKILHFGAIYENLCLFMT